ncbi:hypothetical protein [[Mycobacterium] vasticus]|uniref:Uncharacterized protein n=1 Tax=[Mycobacterium] vasticus TaxID=2875777 RepID=A0ABU5YZR0_9MYCO|nr:hypothetical protein [Mycolicibacter sp. MYC017]MEB3070627.1 hypothetical protein [Mycolicibacter sp. MYC017]
MNHTSARHAEPQAARVVVLGRRLRIAAMVIAAAVFAAAGVGVVMGVAAAGDPGVRMMVKQIKLDGREVEAAREAWAHQYGQDFSRMPNLPDVAAATPEQRAAAADLLARTEAATAAYVDPAKAEAAGYQSIQAALAGAEKELPQLPNWMQKIDAGTMPAWRPMLHVAVQHRDNTVLDPSNPPVLMYDYQGHNTWMLVGVMYVANGAFPGPPPTPGGPITRWHYHDKAPGSLMMHVFFAPDNDLAHAYALNMESMEGMEGMGSM